MGHGRVMLKLRLHNKNKKWTEGIVGMHKNVCPEVGGSTGRIQELKEEQGVQVQERCYGMRPDRQARPHHIKELVVIAVARHGMIVFLRI